MGEHIRGDIAGERPCEVTDTDCAPYRMRRWSASTRTCTLRMEVNDGNSATSQRLWSNFASRSSHASFCTKYVASR